MTSLPKPYKISLEPKLKSKPDDIGREKVTKKLIVFLSLAGCIVDATRLERNQQLHKNKTEVDLMKVLS